MTLIKDEILRTIKENKLNEISFLSSHEWINMYDDIASKYSNKNLFYHALWERLNHSVSCKDEHGWEAIPKLIRDSDCILFIVAEKFGMRLPDCNMLDTILRDTFGFVFYVTKPTTDYLICFNDHDFVIGCGKAETWVADYYNINQ